MNCKHGINIKHQRCDICEEIAQAELDAWPSIEEQEAYWSLRDEGRSDGYGESYDERQT